ncbi:MAG: hydrolase [Candidatus Altiarchaeales archaeon HGW-Altiarchaeales-3]|nr:MAG: hydrolase [Candidatus Altiarchaeales archaeon HGW-Altiarchaeales-3]
MPFTPFHLGAGLLIGMIFFRRINIPAILLASVIVDFRAIYCLFIGHCPMHGFFHTFAGASILGLWVIALIYFSRAWLFKISKLFKIEQNYSLHSIVCGALIGVWVHILLDAFLYPEIHPFWPVEGNTRLLGVMSSPMVYGLCTAGFLIGGLLYVWYLIKS